MEKQKYKNTRNISSYTIALKTTFIYGIIGLIWIWLTDLLVLHFLNDGELITLFQTYKGFFYVLATALLLFFLIKSQIEKITVLSDKLLIKNEKLETRNLQLHKTEKELRNKHQELKQEQEKTYQLAYYDSLTGLPNRKKFKEELDKELKKNTAIGVVFFDIDNFKRINNIYGVKHGDKMLQIFADKLREELIGVKNIARFSGDNFAIFEKDIKDLEELNQFLEKIQDSFTGLFEFFNHSFYISLSMGAALAPIHGTSAQKLINNAENALNQSQQTFTSSLIFDPSMKDRFYFHLQKESNINKALKNNDFFLYYQPIVDTDSGEILSLEALIRWSDKKGSFIPPDRFIPFATRTGQIYPISKWVLNEVCRQQKLWLQDNPSIVTEINLSASEFEREDLPLRVEKTIKKHNIKPEHIRLELTESDLLQDLDKCSSILHELKNMGVNCALDDFGTGYSSLSYLINLPIDTLKLDRDFITNIDKNKNKQDITRYIIKLAHCLDKKVTAEGVETKAELDFLKSINCDTAQGFYLCHPNPPDDLSSLIKNGYIKEKI